MSKDTKLNPRTCNDNTFPHWDRPEALSCFSINSERFYEEDCSNLRYLKIPQKLPLDLNIGIEAANKKPDRDEGLDHLLEHIMSNYPELSRTINKNIDNELSPRKQNPPLHPVEFVAWRGLLRLIMCTPFEYRSDWIINVTRYKGTHYFCQRETKEAQRNRLNSTSLQKRMCSWGYKFEQYCLTKSPDLAPDTDAAVDECAELGCVFYSRLEGLNLLYGAEMDGIISDRTVNINRELQSGNIEFVELKTSFQNMNDRQMHNFQRFKIRNWWCQSFLVGIEDIIVGWRDDEGLIHDIETMKVNHLPKQSKKWTPHQCAQFLVNFLNCVKNIMSTVDCPYTVYEFRYDARNSYIGYDIFEGLTEKTILPDYYIHFMDRLAKSKT